MDRVEQHKKAMLDALEKTLGVVTEACRLVNIGRSTHYLWMEKDPEYKKEVQSIEDIAIDFAESKLHSQIEKGDTTATIFFLKTKGKKRGYIERIEQEVTSNTVKSILIEDASKDKD